MDSDSSANRTFSFRRGKKQPFTSAERELIVALVRERPVIEDKRIHAENIQLKKQAWEDLAQAFNSQPYVSERVTYQLKRCWENMKTQRKKELRSMKKSISTTAVSKKFTTETDTRIKRSTLNIKQDQELQELKLQREQILTEREKNHLEFEREYHNLQIEKIKLEIELLKQQKEN